MIGADRSRRALHALCLFAILSALYFLTYSGYEISNDERILYDGVHSFAQHGNFWLAYTNPLRPPATYPNNAPVLSLDSEPMQVYAAAPLFWLAEAIPGIGLMQTVWLLNVIVTALTGVVFFYFALLLGYRERTALLSAVIFGTATLAWPYSKAFFREPLFTLFALACAYSLERWRRLLTLKGFKPFWLMAATLTLIGAFATKDASFLLLPTLLVIVTPAALRRVDRRALLIGALLILLIGLATILYSRTTNSARYDLFGRIARAVEQAETAPVALAGYLISPGRSIWAYSPVLLSGVWGVRRLWRQKQWRQIAVPLITLAVFVTGYAILQNENWYGGLGWGPRYMLPITPFLTLLLLPVIEALPGAAAWARALFIGLTALSVLVQVIGVLVPVNAYFAFLADEGARLNRGLYGWEDGTWTLAYVPAVIVPQQLGRVPSDIAWLITPSARYVAALCVLVTVLGGVGLWRRSFLRLLLLTHQAKAVYACVLIGSVLILFGAGLRAYFVDPRYGGTDANARAVLEAVTRDVRPGDAVLLNDQAYRPYFMNYYKGRTPIFLLPDAPGEVALPGIPPEIVSDHLDALVASVLTMMLPRIALIAPRWWFVTEFIPADSSRTRATEHYLTRHYFPVRETLTTNTARLIEFSATSAPPDSIPPWPAVNVGARFGEAFTLVGYDLPLTIRRGEVLPLSLLWRHEGWPPGSVPFDYSINLSLIDSAGALVSGAQRAGTPLGSFGLTSQWRAGGYYRDNHGLRIPPDLPPGKYHVWVLLYNWQNQERLPVRFDDQVTGDHLDLVTLKVE